MTILQASSDSVKAEERWYNYYTKMQQRSGRGSIGIVSINVFGNPFGIWELFDFILDEFSETTHSCSWDLFEFPCCIL